MWCLLMANGIFLDDLDWIDSLLIDSSHELQAANRSGHRFPTRLGPSLGTSHEGGLACLNFYQITFMILPLDVETLNTCIVILCDARQDTTDLLVFVAVSEMVEDWVETRVLETIWFARKGLYSDRFISFSTHKNEINRRLMIQGQVGELNQVLMDFWMFVGGHTDEQS